MKHLLISILILVLLTSLVSAGINKSDTFMVGIYEPGIYEWQVQRYHTNLTEYIPTTTEDDDVVVNWWVVMQTGTTGVPGGIGYWGEKFGVETDVPGVSFDFYNYELSTWESIVNAIRRFFGHPDLFAYPFLPPILFSALQVDCDGDGSLEYEFDYYEYPIDNSLFMYDELMDVLWPVDSGKPEAAYYEPPFPQKIEVVKCFYDYDEDAEFKFQANFTVYYTLSPNYWSLLAFSLYNRQNVYPGYFLDGTLVGWDLSACGSPGQILSGRLLPGKGCTSPPITYPVNATGFGKPYYTGGGTNGTHVPGDFGITKSRPEDLDHDIDSSKECHDLYEHDIDKLHDCLEQVAIKEMKENNNLFNFGLNAIRMTFSFILLMFYIMSISIIGFVFAVLIPGVFRKIQLVFSRATRLK